jgi:hypothetical protein
MSCRIFFLKSSPMVSSAGTNNLLRWLLAIVLLLGATVAEAASPLDNWHQRSSPLTNAVLTSINYGNGRFVVSTDTMDRTLTSTNGMDWELHPTPYRDLRKISFANGVFLAWFVPQPATGLPDRIYSSVDGISWTLRYIAPDTDVDIRMIKSGNGKFVAAGTSVLISSDLTNWLPTLDGTVSFTDLAFLNGMFVASDASSIWSSPDAIGWTFRGSSGGGAKVAAGNGKFCMVGYPSGKSLVSADGLTWTQSGTVNVPTPFMLGPLAFAGNYFVALGSTATSNLLVSTNGVDWETHGFGTNWQANGIAFGNNSYVAVGNGSLILQSDTTTGAAPAPPTLGIGQAPNLTITGEPGRDYEIEYTDDLANGTGFQPLATVHMESSELTWVDVTATNAPKRFYRVKVAQ